MDCSLTPSRAREGIWVCSHSVREWFLWLESMNIPFIIKLCKVSSDHSGRVLWQRVSLGPTQFCSVNYPPFQSLSCQTRFYGHHFLRSPLTPLQHWHGLSEGSELLSLAETDARWLHISYSLENKIPKTHLGDVSGSGCHRLPLTWGRALGVEQWKQSMCPV